jgi:hypothetical protein
VGERDDKKGRQGWWAISTLRSGAVQSLAKLTSSPRSLRQKFFCDIWIDSLCIIQDSIDDWQKEASRIGNIYTYAHLTLAAASTEHWTVAWLSTLIQDACSQSSLARTRESKPVRSLMKQPYIQETILFTCVSFE